MIITSLCGFYERMARDPDSGIPPVGFSEENISFALVVRPGGDLPTVIDLRSDDKKPRPRRMITPAPVKRASNIVPSFLWDHTGYVLGVDGKGRQDRTEEMFRSFKELVRNAAAMAGGKESSLAVVSAFLEAWSPERFEELDHHEELLDQNCVFMVAGDDDYVHNLPETQTAWEAVRSGRQSEYTAPCLVTGEESPIARLHPSVKGVFGAQSIGASLVSFDKDSFTSYGKTKSFNAPIGENAAFAYTTALNYLLRRENRRSLRIGDATTVYFAETETPAEDLLAQLLEPPAEQDPKQQSAGPTDDLETTERVRSLLKALVRGVPIDDALEETERDATFYILGLSPNRARLSVRFWHVDTFGEIARRVGEHYAALRIIRQFDSEPEFPSLWRLLLQTAPQGKTENIPPLLGGALARSVLTGAPYPEGLYAAVMTRVRADGGVNYYRAALIKAHLVRNQQKEIPFMLDRKRKDPPYLLGRLFAVTEKIQEEALPGLNATIKDKYFGSASATPGRVFPFLLSNMQNHLAKIRKENPGRSVNLDKAVQEIMYDIETFPATQNIAGQGEFIIGYYQQRKDLFTSNKDKTEE